MIFLLKIYFSLIYVFNSFIYYSVLIFILLKNVGFANSRQREFGFSLQD